MGEARRHRRGHRVLQRSFQKSAPLSELGPAAGPTIAPVLLLAQRGQEESNYKLALAMARGAADAQGMDDEEGRLIDEAEELSVSFYNGAEDATLNRASATMTPRSIWHPSWSTAPSTAPATSAAASTMSAASPPRSRKKIRHRSCLEFLDGGNADKAAPPPASPANKTKQKAQQRRLSPKSKSKLDALSNLRDAAAASIFGEGTDETTKSAVPKMKAAGPSNKRSVKTTTHGNESQLYSRGKSKKCTSKEEAVQSVESQTRSSSQVTQNKRGKQTKT